MFSKISFGSNYRPANSTCQVLGGSGGVWVAALEDDVRVTTHYLTRGDNLDTSDLSVTFPGWKKPVDNQVGLFRISCHEDHGLSLNLLF